MTLWGGESSFLNVTVCPTLAWMLPGANATFFIVTVTLLLAVGVDDEAALEVEDDELLELDPQAASDRAANVRATAAIAFMTVRLNEGPARRHD